MPDLSAEIRDFIEQYVGPMVLKANGDIESGKARRQPWKRQRPRNPKP